MSDSLISSNQRILVIDDNPAIHDDFRKIFKTDVRSDALDATEAALFGDEPDVSRPSTFLLEFAHQGRDGLALVESAVAQGRPYAMAFVDVRMPPGWDGIETVEQLWAVYPDLQVVICTAYSDYSWDEMIEKFGASDRLVILKKPFDNIEVLQLANALTAKWHLLQEVKVRIENLEAMATTRAAELFKSEARYRLIAENASELISVWTKENHRLYTSPSHERVLGINADGLRDAPPCEQVHADDQAAVLLAIETAKRSGIAQVVECRMQHLDRSWRVLESHINPVVNERAEVEHLVIVARDITERTKADDERHQMEVQLRHAQKMESIGQLAAGIAHEINTPTQYIGDNTQFVQDAFSDVILLLNAQARLLCAVKHGIVPAEMVAEVEAAAKTADIEYLAIEIPKAIGQSLEGLHRVSKIVGAMKEFSHPGSHEKTMIDLNRAIESTLTVASHEWKYLAEMVTEFDPTLPLVACLPGEFNQVILNMIVNASHAIGDVIGDGGAGKGTITVGTRQVGDGVEIRIRDTGTGMPEHVRARIFDPFFTTKGVGRGTGQGLAIAHSVIVDKHGGSIQVESEVGQGTTFLLCLPIQPMSSERRAA
jgi:two-component system NtrC family sensor kinase